jgi:hypothetical protein
VVILRNLKQHWNVTYLLTYLLPLFHSWIFQYKQAATSISSKLKCSTEHVTVSFCLFADCRMYQINVVILILYYNLINF